MDAGRCCQLEYASFVTAIHQHRLQLVIQWLAEVHQHIAAHVLVHAAQLNLNAIERDQRFYLGQLFGLDVEGHVLAKRLNDLLEQVHVAVGLEQYGFRQTAHHHPLAQWDRECIVVVDIWIGGQKCLRIGIRLRGFIGDMHDFIVAHAAGADFAD